MNREIFKSLVIFGAIIAIMGCLSVCAAPNKGGVVVDKLKCEAEIEPLGVENKTPALSWQITSNRRGVVQTAYQIQVATDLVDLTNKQTCLWDSGKQLSDKQIGVQVKGVDFESARQYFWRVKVWTNYGESRWSEPQMFGMAMLDQSDWTAEWITRVWEKEHKMPYFRKQFNCKDDKPIRAVAYLSGLGCSELYVNGERIGDMFLDPAQSNYDVYALYTAIDVTEYVRAGENTVGVLLGDGWYNQDVVWGGLGRYGDPILKMQMVMQYADGSTKTVVTDKSWMWMDSPVISSNIYAGELYDARAEIVDWCKNGYKSEKLQNAVLASNTPPSMMSQLMPAMRAQQSIEAVKIFKNAKDNWVFDFGVNIAGFQRISIDQPRNTELTMIMSEALYPDGTLDVRSTGIEATLVNQKDVYVCGGGKERWQPHFSYHGFRYLELSGFVGTPDQSTIQAVVMHSDVEKIGTFSCSDQQINRLHELAVRTMLSNMHGIPTDCPIRERCGWMGDAHAELHIANFNFGMENFWIKYLHDIRSSGNKNVDHELFHAQSNSIFRYGPKPAGLPYMICPGRRACGVASQDWGTAMVQLPWYVYEYYGNERVLAEFYPDMKFWVEYNATLLNEDGLLPEGLGDWCPPGSNLEIDCPITFSSSAFHYHDLTIVERVARLMGKESEAAEFARKNTALRDAIIAKLYDTKAKSFGSQTANSMALDMGLVPDGDQVAVSNAIAEDMNSKYDGFMHSGIFGLPRIGKALSEHGNKAQAWKMFTKKGNRSFAEMWEKYDATSLWELMPTDSISARLGLTSSHNHSMQAGYDAWFYESVAGIKPCSESPGYKCIVFNPSMTEFLSWAKACVETPYGKAISSWKKDGEKVAWEVVVPANTTAEVYVPKDRSLMVDGKNVNIKENPVIRHTGSSIVYSFSSGSYMLKF